MYSRKPTSTRSALIRNLVGVAGAIGITLIVFMLMAAFNGALKVFNEVTTGMNLRCREGYDLVPDAQGYASCAPKPLPPVPGIVPVILPKLTDVPASSKPKQQP